MIKRFRSGRAQKPRVVEVEPRHNPLLPARDFDSHQHMRLMSFNIQVGINTSSFHHYLTKSWQHLLPHAERTDNLEQIGRVIREFDLVALQEVDAGSLRSGFVNQVQYLARCGGFPFWHQQLNRDLGRLAKHGNGLLCRFRPLGIQEHRLPGYIPGRGAMLLTFGDAKQPLVVVVLHLALGSRAQYEQLAYIHDLIADYEYVIVMGDMNSQAEKLLSESPLRHTNLVPGSYGHRTFPSWQPEVALDHIMLSPSLTVVNSGVIDCALSDHLPIAVDIVLPQSEEKTD